MKNKKMTYSSISQANIPPQMSIHRSPEALVTREDLLKMNICVAIAETKNKENPGTFATILNKTLSENNLPTIVVPVEFHAAPQDITQQTALLPQTP